MMKKSLLSFIALTMLCWGVSAQEYFNVVREIDLNHDNTQPKGEEEPGTRFDMVYKRAKKIGLVETEIMIDPAESGNRIPYKLIPSKQSQEEYEDIIFKQVGMKYSSSGKSEILGLWVAFAEYIQKGDPDIIEFDVHTKVGGQWFPGSPFPFNANEVTVNRIEEIESNPDSAFTLFLFEKGTVIEVDPGSEFICSMFITYSTDPDGNGDTGLDIISVYSTLPGTANQEGRAYLGYPVDGLTQWFSLDNIAGPVKNKAGEYEREAGKIKERQLKMDVDFMIYPIYTGTLASIQESYKVADITYLGTFPNPAESMVNFNFNMLKPAPVTVSVMDVTGRVLMKSNRGVLPTGVQTVGMDISSLNAGQYVYMIESNGGSHRGILNVR